MIIGIGGAD